jgi:carbon storage regulator
MLVLSRKRGESFTIGNDIEIKLLQIKGDKMLVGIKAPLDQAIKRDNMKKSITKEPIEQAEQAREGNLFKWGF